MPGLFDNSDNQGGGILQGIGNYFNNIAGNMDPAFQENLFRRRAYQALSQQNGPQDAAILMGNPPAYGLALQRQLFISQLQSLMGPDPNNPKMSLTEALYRLSPEGQKQQYGVTPVPGFKTPSGAEAPGTIAGGQINPPPGMGFPGPALAGPAQPQPSQQPAAVQPQPQGPAPFSPMDQAGINYNAAKAAAVKAAESTAAAQPDLPILQTRAQEVINRLQGIKNNPELPNVVGGPLGIKGRTGPLGQGQSDLLSDIQDANNALQGDLFTSMRTISNGGRPPSPGAMKEMRITDLNARTGTVQAYKDNIDRTIKQVQNEYEAAWKARSSPDAYKPNWKSSAPINISVPPQAAAYLKANPHLRTQFDAKYGDGAALSVLGQ